MDLTDLADDTGGDIAALLGSRICHDLISPLGAIGNGVELLTMSGADLGPELQLIAESVQAASARIRFFRVAFGAAGPGQRLGRAEVLATLTDLGRGGRIAYDWQVAGDPPRDLVKLAFLALLCLESAMIRGGQLTVTESGGDWRIIAMGERLKQDDSLWSRLRGRPDDSRLPAAQVQFALIDHAARRAGRTLRIGMGDGTITIGF